MTFEAQLAGRNAADYADFLLAHLAPDARVLDVGCGAGTISLGLAARVGHVIGIDLDDEKFAEARAYAARQNIGTVEYRVGSVYELAFPDATFDACLCHSVLETLDRPLDALLEIRRVLKPGGVLGAASVEYGGLILGGPQAELLRRFYSIRERLWQLDAVADPYRGRTLRSLLHSSGFEGVVASSKYFSYGTSEAVKSFGRARAADSRDDAYISAAQKYGLASQSDLDAMQQAWLEWSESEAAYAAFAWCRAIGWRRYDYTHPRPESQPATHALGSLRSARRVVSASGETG